MTGVIGRLRSWLGSLFGDGPEPDVTGAADGTTTEDRERRVVHRDDRPLETPNTMPPASDEETITGETERRRDPDVVSIPDAESAADEEALRRVGTGTVLDEGDDDRDAGGAVPSDSAAGPIDAADVAGADVDAEEEVDTDGDEAFACAVCGTTVDDPTAACPLCGSSDVVPVTDAAEADGSVPDRRDRTTVVPADDEAVDRLRDLGAGAERDG